MSVNCASTPPHTPSAELLETSPAPHHTPAGLDLLLSAYRALLPQLRSGITSSEGIHTGRLQLLLARLARDEEAAYQRRAVSRG